ncbi:MAG TPA: hypothetical protein VHH34_07435 [Pseudonocardiaceae bacterium]|nr:hypothetical protein [Pseudonocardiaceae bacterium]
MNAFQPSREIWVTTAHEIGHLIGWNEAQCRAFEYFAAKEYAE